MSVLNARRWPLAVLGTAAVALVIFSSGAVAGGGSSDDSIEPAQTISTSSIEPPAEQATPEGPPIAVVEPAEPLTEPAPNQTASEPLQAVGVADTAGPLHPLRVRIPRIGVDAPIIDLGLNPDRTLEVPSDYDDTGWYTGRSVPGELGPSVVVGHVDSQAGPAVFYRLRDLVVGDRVQIERSDGLVAWFEVTETILVDKDEFPTEDVYGGTEDAELRLITCGGSFDRDERSYRGNLIVYAKHVGNFEPGQSEGPG